MLSISLSSLSVDHSLVSYMDSSEAGSPLSLYVNFQIIRVVNQMVFL